jgi:hypothetical protein
VKRRSTVEKNRMFADHLFEDVPNDRLLAFDHLTCLLDRRRMCVLLKLVVDERLEQLERHLLRQTALVKLQLRTNDDHRTARVVDTLTEQVLTEASLFTLERARQRLERTIVRTAKNASRRPLSNRASTAS